MGGHRVPAGLDDHDADRREARRHVRAEARAPGGPGRLPRRLRALRAQPEHARADRLPGDPGARRRRADGQHAGRDRRRRLSARARPLLRADGRRVRRLDGGRPAGRRAVRRPPVVALDLLHQPADRDRRVRRAQVVLHAPPRRSATRSTTSGMALLAGGLTAIVLFTSLGGTTYAVVVGADGRCCSQSASLLSVGFVVAERFAREPLVPLGLFRNRVFAVASAVGFIVGMALFGSVTYLPLYLQVVKGAGPTESGLQMLPLMAGVLIASIGSGQVITRYGRYKVFPIVGTALMVVGMLLLSRLDVGTGLVVADLYMLVRRARARLRHAGARARRPERRRLRRTSAWRPRPRRSSARWAARSASPSSARSSPTSSRPTSRRGFRRRPRPACRPHLGPSQIDALPDGDPRAVRGGLRRVAAAGVPDRRRDRRGRVPRHMAAGGEAAAPDRRRPGARRQLRRAARGHLARRAGDAAQHARAQAEPPPGLRRLAAEAGLDLEARETWLLLRLDAGEGDADRAGGRARAPARRATAPLASPRPTGRRLPGRPRGGGADRGGALRRDPAASRRVGAGRAPGGARPIQRFGGSSRRRRPPPAPAPA